jgi:hypothetical protein
MFAASARCIVLVGETTRLSNRRWLFAPTKARPSSEARARRLGLVQVHVGCVETGRLSNRRWLCAPTKARPSSEAWARATVCCQAQDDPAITDFRPACANIRDLLAVFKEPADAASSAVRAKMHHSSQVRYSNRRSLCAKVAAWAAPQAEVTDAAFSEARAKTRHSSQVRYSKRRSLCANTAD